MLLSQRLLGDVGSVDAETLWPWPRVHCMVSTDESAKGCAVTAERARRLVSVGSVQVGGHGDECSTDTSGVRGFHATIGTLAPGLS